MSDFEFSTKTNWTLISSFIWGKVDRPQVLFSGHGREANNTDVEAREKSAVKLFATCQLCSVGGRWIVWFCLFSPNLHLVHSVLCKAVVSNHRNCLHLALFLETFWDVFSRLTGIFHFQRNYHDSCTTTRPPLKGEWTEIFWHYTELDQVLSHVFSSSFTLFISFTRERVFV